MSEESFFFFSFEDGGLIVAAIEEGGRDKTNFAKEVLERRYCRSRRNGRLAFDNEAYHTALDRDRMVARPCCAHFSRVRVRGHSSRRIEAEW